MGNPILERLRDDVDDLKKRVEVLENKPVAYVGIDKAAKPEKAKPKKKTAKKSG
jgi:hypothetical protein